MDAKYTAFSSKNSFEYQGKTLHLEEPEVMGILNVTPDSFFDGGQFSSEKDILQQAEQILTEGAKIIDIGGYSSRPGADDVPPETELKRTLVAVRAISKEFPDALISVDTFRSLVAKQALDNGAFMINDISSGTADPAILDTVASYGCPYILMHMRGTPQNMTQNTNYDNLVEDVYSELADKVNDILEKGVNQIIVDPGFGFAKTLEQNYELLRKLEKFTEFNLPILVGLSRKSMIYKKLSITPQEALNGTTALNMIALQKGAKILRVHDVKEAMQTIELFKMIK